ncbi:hypothetical protein FRB93_006359 [Tulasnella sp. JGI-2019a]|nr:hypothetical protein FRB93_006359 [Tulasnella sp. JGI-2019a]
MVFSPYLRVSSSADHFQRRSSSFIDRPPSRAHCSRAFPLLEPAGAINSTRSPTRPFQQPPSLLTTTTSEPMPTANLPRGHACIECHNRKSRCDGGKPICSSCRRSHRQCVYNEPVVKSGQQQLLERMRQLEEMLAEIQADPRTSISSAGSTTSPSPPSPRSLSSHGEGQRSSSGSSQSRSRSPRADGELVPGTNMTWNRPGVVPTPPPTEMTRHLRQNLINYFFLHREKCFFEVHVPRFTAALSLSSGNPNALHPALVNAVLLIGCYWARAASLATLESQLLGLRTWSPSTTSAKACTTRQRYKSNIAHVWPSSAACIKSSPPSIGRRSRDNMLDYSLPLVTILSSENVFILSGRFLA